MVAAFGASRKHDLVQSVANQGQLWASFHPLGITAICGLGRGVEAAESIFGARLISRDRKLFSMGDSFREPFLQRERASNHLHLCRIIYNIERKSRCRQHAWPLTSQQPYSESRKAKKLTAAIANLDRSTTRRRI